MHTQTHTHTHKQMQLIFPKWLYQLTPAWTLLPEGMRALLHIFIKALCMYVCACTCVHVCVSEDWAQTFVCKQGSALSVNCTQDLYFTLSQDLTEVSRMALSWQFLYPSLPCSWDCSCVHQALPDLQYCIFQSWMSVFLWYTACRQEPTWPPKDTCKNVHSRFFQNIPLLKTM